MITFSLAQAAEAMGATLQNGSATDTFEGVCIDSRRVTPGVLYVPIVGARADGHDFARQAVEDGAAATLWQADHTPYPTDFPVLIVKDPVTAMGRLAKAWLKTLNCLVIGITGSNGKTSAKDLCASIFAQSVKTWKTQGNHNNEIGLPQTVFEADADTQVLILEMGMENRGEIAYLCEIAPLDIAIITSIGSAHMENLGSMDNIARAKCEIVTSLKANGALVYNQDNDSIKLALSELELNPAWTLIPYGKGSEFAPCNLRFSREGLSFDLPAVDDEPFFVRAASFVQADNATAAILAARFAGISLEDCHIGCAEAVLTPMRGQLLDWKEAVLLDDTYKSNPQAALSALRTLMAMPASCHVAVLADMLDLGPLELEEHAAIGRAAGELGVDVLFAYGARSKATADACSSKVVRHFENKEDLIEALQPYGDQQAAILIKGSRAMAMDEIVAACLERKETHE